PAAWIRRPIAWSRDGHQLLGVAVVLLEIVVTNRPVASVAVGRLKPEVLGKQPGRAGPPAIRAPAECQPEHPRLARAEAIVAVGRLADQLIPVREVPAMIAVLAALQNEHA